MKTTSRKFKLMMAFCLTLILPLGAFAAPDIYVCSTGTVTLAYTGTYTLVTGDKVVWQKVLADGTPVSGYTAVVNEYTGTAGSANLTVTGGTELNAVGDHYWVAHVISADPATCTGDVSPLIDIYMLPAYTLAVTPATGGYCIDGTTNLTKTTISSLATPANSAILPAGVVFAYAWVTTPSTGVGAVDSGDPKIFNMTSTTVGTYTVTSNVTYDVSATGKTLKSPGGNACIESGSATIKVSAKPGAPVITVS